MPTIHVNQKTWDKVREKTIDAVLSTREPFKETEILKILIEIGVENITQSDFEKAAKEKKTKGHK